MKRSILPTLLLISGTIFAWYKILFQVPLGEGYYYFDPGQDFFREGLTFQPLGSYLAHYDNLPRLVFDFLPPLFKDNLMPYQGFELLNLVLLSITIYFVINYFFKNKWLSFMATFLFSVSYVGLFEIIATGNYQRFIQRVPNFIFLFISFWLLAKYFETKKIKYYLFSILTFATTVFLAHYSTFLLPLFMIYPLIRDKNILISAPYLLVNYLLIKNDFYTSGVSPSFDINLILLQLSNITYPPSLLNSIAAIAQPYTKTVVFLSIPIIFTYLMGIYLVKKREPKYLAFYLTSFLTLFSILYLNLLIGKIDYMTFVRGDRYYFIPVETLSQLGVGFIGGSRYYVLPSIFNSIIFSTIFWVLLKNGRRLFYFLSTTLLTIYLIYNTSLIWKEIDAIQPVSERMKMYLSYTKSISPELRRAGLVITSPEFIWSGQFVRLFYGNENLEFGSLDKETLSDTIIISCNAKECKQQ